MPSYNCVKALFVCDHAFKRKLRTSLAFEVAVSGNHTIQNIEQNLAETAKKTTQKTTQKVCSVLMKIYMSKMYRVENMIN